VDRPRSACEHGGDNQRHGHWPTCDSDPFKTGRHWCGNRPQPEPARRLAFTNFIIDISPLKHWAKRGAQRGPGVKPAVLHLPAHKPNQADGGPSAKGLMLIKTLSNLDPAFGGWPSPYEGQQKSTLGKAFQGGD